MTKITDDDILNLFNGAGDMIGVYRRWAASGSVDAQRSKESDTEIDNYKQTYKIGDDLSTCDDNPPGQPKKTTLINPEKPENRKPDLRPRSEFSCAYDDQEQEYSELKSSLLVNN